MDSQIADLERRIEAEPDNFSLLQQYARILERLGTRFHGLRIEEWVEQAGAKRNNWEREKARKVLTSIGIKTLPALISALERSNSKTFDVNILDVFVSLGPRIAVATEALLDLMEKKQPLLVKNSILAALRILPEFPAHDHHRLEPAMDNMTLLVNAAALWCPRASSEAIYQRALNTQHYSGCREFITVLVARDDDITARLDRQMQATPDAEHLMLMAYLTALEAHDEKPELFTRALDFLKHYQAQFTRPWVDMLRREL